MNAHTLTLLLLAARVNTVNNDTLLNTYCTVSTLKDFLADIFCCLLWYTWYNVAIKKNELTYVWNMLIIYAHISMYKKLPI